MHSTGAHLHGSKVWVAWLCLAWWVSAIVCSCGEKTVTKRKKCYTHDQLDVEINSSVLFAKTFSVQLKTIENKKSQAKLIQRSEGRNCLGLTNKDSRFWSEAYRDRGCEWEENYWLWARKRPKSYSDKKRGSSGECQKRNYLWTKSFGSESRASLWVRRKVQFVSQE